MKKIVPVVLGLALVLLIMVAAKCAVDGIDPQRVGGATSAASGDGPA